MTNLLTNFIKLNALSNAQNSGGQSIWTIIIVYGLVFAALYFFFIRPKSKKQKEETKMRDQLEIGDDITTIGGIVGRVVAIKEDEDAIIIETGSDRAKMKFKKWAISTVDTVKETVSDKGTGTTEKKGFFDRFKKDKAE